MPTIGPVVIVSKSTSAGWRPRAQGDLLSPARIGAEGGWLRERPGLIGDDLGAFLPLTPCPDGVLLTFSTVDTLGAGGAGSVVEDGGLSAPIEPHGRRGGEILEYN
jgi:hypothetical protein